MENFDEKDDWNKGKSRARCNQGLLMWFAPAIFLLGFVVLTMAAVILTAGTVSWPVIAPYIILAGLCLLLCAVLVLALIFSTLLWSHVQSQANQP